MIAVDIALMLIFALFSFVTSGQERLYSLEGAILFALLLPVELIAAS